MSFKKSFDSLLAGLLRDIQNQDPDADVSKGSLLYHLSAALASAIWGLYEHQDWISRQIFPDTSDTSNLEHWCYIFGVSRKTGESDKDLLTRLLNHIQEHPAGGNKNDYEQWALEITNVTAAYCYPLIYGLATVGVIILADEDATGSEAPSSHTGVSGTSTSVSPGKLVDSAATFVTDGVRPGDIVENGALGTETTVASVDSETELTLASDIFTATGQSYGIKSLVTQVKEHIEEVQPILPLDALTVFGPSIQTQDVTMALTGDDSDASQTIADIEAYMNSLEPDQTLYVSQLIAIALNNGAENAQVTVPSADVVPAQYGMIRPGTVTVT